MRLCVEVDIFAFSAVRDDQTHSRPCDVARNEGGRHQPDSALCASQNLTAACIFLRTSVELPVCDAHRQSRSNQRCTRLYSRSLWRKSARVERRVLLELHLGDPTKLRCSTPCRSELHLGNPTKFRCPTPCRSERVAWFGLRVSKSSSSCTMSTV